MENRFEWCPSTMEGTYLIASAIFLEKTTHPRIMFLKVIFVLPGATPLGSVLELRHQLVVSLQLITDIC